MTTDNNQREDFTAASLAREANVSRVYIARLCREGKIPAKKHATVWIITFEEGSRWIKEREASLKKSRKEP